MAPGDQVAYEKDPSLYGIMTIARVEKDGTITCYQEWVGEIGPFQAKELVPAGEKFIRPVLQGPVK